MKEWKITLPYNEEYWKFIDEQETMFEQVDLIIRTTFYGSQITHWTVDGTEDAMLLFRIVYPSAKIEPIVR